MRCDLKPVGAAPLHCSSVPSKIPCMMHISFRYIIITLLRVVIVTSLYVKTRGGGHRVGAGNWEPPAPPTHSRSCLFLFCARRVQHSRPVYQARRFASNRPCSRRVYINRRSTRGVTIDVWPQQVSSEAGRREASPRLINRLQRRYSSSSSTLCSSTVVSY